MAFWVFSGGPAKLGFLSGGIHVNCQFSKMVITEMPLFLLL